MDCRAFEAFLPGLVDGTVDADTAGRMAAHLRSCRTCQALHTAHRIVGQSLSQAEPVPAPAGFEARLFAAVERGAAVELFAAYRRRQARIAAAVLVGLIPVYAGLANLWVEQGSPRLGNGFTRLLAGKDPLAGLVSLWHRTTGFDLAGALKTAVTQVTGPVHLPVTDIAVYPLCLAAAVVALAVRAWYGSTTWPPPRIHARAVQQSS